MWYYLPMCCDTEWFVEYVSGLWICHHTISDGISILSRGTRQIQPTWFLIRVWCCFLWIPMFSWNPELVCCGVRLQSRRGGSPGFSLLRSLAKPIAMHLHWHLWALVPIYISTYYCEIDTCHSAVGDEELCNHLLVPTYEHSNCVFQYHLQYIITLATVWGMSWWILALAVSVLAFVPFWPIIAFKF